MSFSEATTAPRIVQINIDRGVIEGEFVVPKRATGIVIFAHGSGSSRHSSRNQFVAKELRSVGFGTLLIDLLTSEEERVDIRTRHLRFDIPLLAERVLSATDWVVQERESSVLPIGYFGASTGAAAALVAAARRPEVAAVVSRGGRPDLAGDFLPEVKAATLLIVGGEDHEVIELNRMAQAQLTRAAKAELQIVPGATHLFEEAGTLEDVVRLASSWFSRHFAATRMPTEGEIFVW
jgi:putative phosphoribosyl transferase